MRFVSDSTTYWELDVVATLINVIDVDSTSQKRHTTLLRRWINVTWLTMLLRCATSLTLIRRRNNVVCPVGTILGIIVGCFFLIFQYECQAKRELPTQTLPFNRRSRLYSCFFHILWTHWIPAFEYVEDKTWQQSARFRNSLPPFCKIWIIFTHLKWIASATHNFKGVKISIKQIGG